MSCLKTGLLRPTILTMHYVRWAAAICWATTPAERRDSPAIPSPIAVSA